MSEDPAQQNADAAEEAPAVGQEAEDQEPDVLLDVSNLEVDRIGLEVEDLRAHVSILAELANLLSLSVGVDARLDRVKLEIEGPGALGERGRGDDPEGVRRGAGCRRLLTKGQSATVPALLGSKR